MESAKQTMMQSKPSSSSDELTDNDPTLNNYTSSEQEDDGTSLIDDRHELLNGVDIGEEVKSSFQKAYKGNFSTLKEETYGCPYGSCGRKFVSAG